MTDKITAITTERGKRYGHPADHFCTTTALARIWRDRHRHARYQVETPLPDGFASGVEHAVYMILDKLVRIAHDPTHIDNWDDIEGYSQCAKRILSREHAVGDEPPRLGT